MALGAPSDARRPHLPRRRYAKDLLAERFISRAFPLWVLAGLALALRLGVALTGSLLGGVTGLLVVRIAPDHQQAKRSAVGR